MKLLRLCLENFRQHAETEIVFQPGLTGIIGPNGEPIEPIPGPPLTLMQSA